MDNPEFILNTENLTIHRVGRDILHAVNLHVPKGVIYSILGPNGAGKSSLAYSIMGLDSYALSYGKIFFEGKDISQRRIWERARKGITLAWQEPSTFEGLSVEDYLTLSSASKSPEGIRNALKSVGMDPQKYIDRSLDSKLSGGERKRIELASVLLMNPKLAILDEPDSGIDMTSRDVIKQAIYTLKEKGSTVLLITHREDLAEMADRMALLCDGILEREGCAPDVLSFFKTKCVKCKEESFD